MEEYMESELSGIFQVKLVTKNIERGSLGTQFMHMRVKCTNVMEITNIIIVHRAYFGCADFNLVLMPDGFFYFCVKGFCALIFLELDKTLLH